MTNIEKNDYFYLCALIEFTARQTLNRRSVVVNALGQKGIEKQLKDACVNHCLTFEQVSSEIIEYYNIPQGNFDTITNCKYSIPNFQDIGHLYAYMIDSLATELNESYINILIKLFNSFISDEISIFNTGIYYENQSFLQESFKAGRLLLD